MAVAFDAKSTAWTNVSGVAALDHALITVGSGSNTALIALLVFSSSTTPTSLSVHWDSAGTNQAMTAIAGTTLNDATDPVTIVLYGLVAPTSGAKNLHVSWTGNLEGHACCVSFTGVDQTGGSTSFPHGTTHTGSGSIVITSATGNMVVACYADNSTGFLASDTTGTQIQFQDVGPNDGSDANYQNGAASVTCTCTPQGAGGRNVGCDILAAGGSDVLQSQIVM